MNSIFMRTCAYGTLVVGLLPTSAWAQTASAPSQSSSEAKAAPSASTAQAPATTDDSGTLADIIVTAQKRTENIQRTPVAISAIGSDALDRATVRDFSTLQKVAPDVIVDSVAGATNIAIRGVRQSTSGPTSDSTTAVHLDGAYLARSTGLTGAFYDIERVEVLKGPQGTLYGRNATGGVVNILTNKPTQTLGVTGEAEVGNYGTYRFEGSVNVPVSDLLSLRAAGRVYKHDGYLSNGLEDADQKGGRLEALFTFSPDLKLLVTGDYEVSDRKGPGLSLLGKTIGSRGGPVSTATIPSDPFDASAVLYPAGAGPSREFQKIYGAMAQIDADLGFAALTVQGAYRRNTSLINTLSPGDTAPAPTGPAADSGYSLSTSASTTATGEVRLTSLPGHPLQWVAGAYYFYEASSGDNCIGVSLHSNFCFLDIANPFNRTYSIAAFGQATYTPPGLTALHLTAGIRYSDDKKRADTYTTILGTPAQGGVYLSNLSGLKATFDKVTYRAGAAYDITPHNMFFANVSTGFRAGGFAYGSTPVYKPETVTAFELGSKNRFFGNRVELNIDAFHYNYRNVEQSVMAPTGPGDPPFLPFRDLTVQSIGQIYYTGVGTQLSVAATRRDHFDADVEYLYAKYGNYVIPPQFISGVPIGANGAPIAGAVPGDFSNQRVPNTPTWSGTAGYDHTFTIKPGTLDFRAAMQWSAARHFVPFPTNSVQYTASSFPGYARFDLSLRYDSLDGRFNLTAYVNNVADARTVSVGSYENTFGLGCNDGCGLVVGRVMAPRTFGFIAGFKL